MSVTLPAFLLVGVGGTAGAVARHVVGEHVETRTRDTLVVNLLGSFALGVLLSLPVGESIVLAVGTGFCGAFTTFSSFAFETVRLFETGQRRRALVNAASTLVGALVAVLLGTVLASSVG